MHKHNHSCTCDHERVKHCKTCKVIHCLDCNQEWTPRSLQFNWTYSPYYSAGGTTYGGLTYRTAEFRSTDDNVTQTLTATSACNHGGSGAVQK